MATRIATTAEFHSVRPGDMIVEPDGGGGAYLRADLGLQTDGNPYTGDDINTPDRMLASLTAGKRIHIDGSATWTNNVRLYLRDLDSLQISNVNGQFKLEDSDNDANNYPTFEWNGGTNITVTGKYEAGVSGDPAYLGHEWALGYAYSSGKYGIDIDRMGLPGDQSFTVQGDDKSVNYVDGRQLDYVAPSGYEIEFIEGRNGGFTFFDIKHLDNSNLDGYDDFKIHDCYLHDIGSEGCYNGNNSISATANVLTNFLFYNNRIIRTGTEGMQWGMLGVGSKIYNNVVAFSSMQRWNNEFAFGENTQDFQDGLFQLDVFDGSVEVHSNIFLGGGAMQIRMNGIVATYPVIDGGGAVVSGTLKVYNNLFMGTFSGNCIYIGQTIPQTTNHLSLEIYDNYFGDLDNLYGERGEPATDAYAIQNNNDDNTISIHDNVYDTSFTAFYKESSTSSTVTLADNTQGSVPRPVFTDWGLDDDHDYRNIVEWASVYGDYTTNDGNPIVYTAGDYVYHDQVIYECTNEASSIEPPNTDYWRVREFPLSDSPIEPPVNPFNPFTDIAWIDALDPATASDIATDEYWTNQVNDPDGNFLKNGTDNIPVYNAGGGTPYLQFTTGDITVLTMPATISASDPYDIWTKINVTDIAANQYVFAYGTNVRLRVNSDGTLLVGSVTTSSSISFGVDNVIRITRDALGAGSVTINNGTPDTETFTTGGASTGLIGANDNKALPSTHKQYEYFAIASQLSAEEITNMWTWFGL